MLTLLLTIEALDAARATILHNLPSADQLQMRIHELSFELAESLSLQADGARMQPAIVHLEPDFGIRSRLNFNVVFPLSIATLARQREPVVVTFVDPTFGTGVHQFAFEPRRLQESMNIAS